MEENKSRREFIKKLAYMPPAIASLTVLPAFQAAGSGWGNRRPRDQQIPRGLGSLPPRGPGNNNGRGPLNNIRNRVED